MSPPSVFDRFGRMPTFPFTRQPSNGVPNRSSTTEGNVVPGPSSPVSPVTTSQTSEIFQCFREACGCLFSDDSSWRSHSNSCNVRSTRYQCVFKKCAEKFSSDSTDAFIRHEKMHRIWVCKKAECLLQFDKRDKALKHAAKDHKLESPGDLVREMWITTSLKRKRGTRSQQDVDLELTNFLEELEAKVLGKANGIPVLDTAMLKNTTIPKNTILLNNTHPSNVERTQSNGHAAHVALPSAVFTSVTQQLNIINSLLDHHSLIPTASESEKLQQALDRLQEKLRIGEKRRTVPDGWNENFDFNSPAASHQHISTGSPTANHQSLFGRLAHLPQRPKHLSPPQSTDISPSHEVSPNHQLIDIGLQSEGDSDDDLEEVLEHLSGTINEEPRQAINLEKSEQLRYFEAMQKCCIEAAFTFYQRHKSHLDTINDRSSKPLCQTAKKGPIESSTDLSLPHWTHLLRRISDARGLQKEMVSRIESFNGDISPVDELQHAFKKEKVKSDRDLLALIQLTRNFCWQLKDWDRCKDLDCLYDLMDKEIRQVKRNDSQTSRKRRPNLHKGKAPEISGFRSPHRQSATWPRTIPDTAEDAHE